MGFRSFIGNQVRKTPGEVARGKVAEWLLAELTPFKILRDLAVLGLSYGAGMYAHGQQMISNYPGLGIIFAILAAGACLLVLVFFIWAISWIKSKVRPANISQHIAGATGSNAQNPVVMDGIRIVFGTGLPFDKFDERITRRIHHIRIGVENTSSHRLTDCELELTNISGTLAGKCPVKIRPSFGLNPGRSEYIPIASMAEGKSGTPITRTRDIELHFPINPLASAGGRSLLENDEPHDLSLTASAAESAPHTVHCHLWVDGNGILRLDERQAIAPVARDAIAVTYGGYRATSSTATPESASVQLGYDSHRLRVEFDERSLVCRVPARLRDGTNAIWFRLIVTNSTGMMQANCTAAITGISRSNVFQKFEPLPLRERVPICWAKPLDDGPPLTTDIANGDFRHLDVFLVTEKGRIVIATDGLQWPRSMDYLFDHEGVTYKIEITLNGGILSAQKYALCLFWTGQWEATRVEACTP